MLNLHQTSQNIMGHTPPESALTLTPRPQTKEKERQQNIVKKADYLISYPSQGSVIQKHPITMTYHQNDEASSLIPQELSDKIQISQDVILYDKDQNTMPLGGRIKSKTTTKTGQAEIIIKLPEGTKTKYLSNEGNVITLEARASFRFPLITLQQESPDNYYVWSVIKTAREGKFKVSKLRLNHILIGDDHFSSANISKQTLIVLEPDNKIQDNKIYKMAQVQYSAPTDNPISEAKQAYRLSKTIISYNEAKQRIANCRNSAKKQKQGIVDAPQSGSCTNNTFDEKATPMEIFNSILLKQWTRSTAPQITNIFK